MKKGAIEIMTDAVSLLVSCTEYYAYLKNIAGNHVYVSLEKNGLVNTLLQTQVHFPSMDLDFYMGLLDGLLAMESDATENAYAAYKARTELVIDVVNRIAKTHHMQAPEACQMYYNSRVAEAVSEDSTNYYQKSADEIFALVEQQA